MISNYLTKSTTNWKNKVWFYLLYDGYVNLYKVQNDKPVFKHRIAYDSEGEWFEDDSQTSLD